MIAVDLPLTPFFFQKLGMFQELTDKKLVQDKHLWRIEKRLLKWTLTEHQHLSTPISIDSAIHIFTIVLKEKEVLKINKPDQRQIIGIVLGNLCQRGYAIPIERSLEKNQSYSEPIGPNLYRPGELYIEKVTIPQVAIGTPEEIVFTQRGLLAGRVLVEIEDDHEEWKYSCFIKLLWFSIFVLFLTTILIPFLNLIKTLLISLLSYFSPCILNI